MKRRWSRVLLFLCGIRLRVFGEPARNDPVLWVANHVSWVDPFVLNSVRPSAFIAKSEIRAWPVLGWLVAGAGTLFIERGQRHAIRRVGRQMADQFHLGEVVGLFPEGATSAGFDVEPFHSSLFHAAINAGAPVQPVALRFLHRGERSARFAFVGEQTLLRNAWLLLGATGVAIECEFLAVMTNENCRNIGRSKTAAHAHHVIRQSVAARCERSRQRAGLI